MQLHEIISYLPLNNFIKSVQVYGRAIVMLIYEINLILLHPAEWGSKITSALKFFIVWWNYEAKYYRKAPMLLVFARFHCPKKELS